LKKSALSAICFLKKYQGNMLFNTQINAGFTGLKMAKIACLKCNSEKVIQNGMGRKVVRTASMCYSAVRVSLTEDLFIIS